MVATTVEAASSKSGEIEAPEMLELMRQCTHQLDEILEQLCATTRDEEVDVKQFVSVEKGQEQLEDAKESDADYEDCISESQKFRIPLPASLPELLKVSVRGTHDDTNNANSSSFRQIHISTPLPRNRIVEAACSRTHTLLLNDMGLIFAYGHYLDGALGLGDQLSGYVSEPTLVDFFFDNLIVVERIACGGDQITGAHSAAVSQDGSLFTWGVGIALGIGTLTCAATPQRIELPPNETSGEDLTTSTSTRNEVRSITCGSGFCVAITRKGRAFSWGKWGDGRLGLGRIPIVAKTSRRHGGGAVRKQFQLFQLYPKQIQSVYSVEGTSLSDEVLFLKVACGDAHCVGLTSEGELVTWGRGISGQQGRGDLSDAFSPTLVFKMAGKRWHDIAAGENWSMVLTSDGQVWTWGACGGAVLGHGLYDSEKNALLAETILQRHQRLLSQHKQSGSLPCPKLPKLKWMTPQMIPCFATPDIRVCQISAGAQHAAAISDNGDLYMWGDQHTRSSIDDTDSNIVVLSSLPKLTNSGQRVGEGVPNGRNTPDIGTHSVERVVCGGRQTIAFTSGSFLARSMSKLYRDSISGEMTAATGADLVLVVSGQRLLAHKVLLAQRSPVLRELILDEEQQLQNQVTIRESNESNRAIPGELMELLLPRLRVDVAQALVEYFYTDNFTMEVNKNSYYLVHDVLRAAKLYKLPSLVQLCRERLFSASPSSLFGASAPSPELLDIAEDDMLSDTNSEEDVDEQENIGGDATRTLKDDMKFALSDEVWADTVLIAEGRSIPVHRCMLIARSEYFRALLAFQRSAENLPGSVRTATKTAVVNVEDSYAGIVRVLRFIYYDQVALPHLKWKGEAHQEGVASNDNVDDDTEVEHESEEDVSGQLLEDLVAADKYGLERMKRLCEHAICVTTANCFEVLAVAELIHAAHLKQVALRYVQTHLADVTARREEFQRFHEHFPQLLEELYASLRDASQEEFLLRGWHTEVSTILAAQREERELEWGKKSKDATFPWVPLSLTVTFGAMYLSMMHAQEHEYSVVPATNLVAIAAIGGAIFMGYL